MREGIVSRDGILGPIVCKQIIRLKHKVGSASAVNVIKAAFDSVVEP